jgi:protein required for attachment to host cells
VPACDEISAPQSLRVVRQRVSKPLRFLSHKFYLKHCPIHKTLLEGGTGFARAWGKERYMNGYWFIVASQIDARVFTEVKENKFRLVKSFSNPLGRERNRVLRRKKPGMGMRSSGHSSSHRQTRVGKHDPHDEVATQFARKIINFLEQAFIKKDFRSLTIVAEPRFLGKLKSAMTPKIKKTVKNWVEKDLEKISAHDLPQIPKIKEVRSEPVAII